MKNTREWLKDKTVIWVTNDVNTALKTIKVKGGFLSVNEVIEELLSSMNKHVLNSKSNMGKK